MNRRTLFGLPLALLGLRRAKAAKLTAHREITAGCAVGATMIQRLNEDWAARIKRYSEPNPYFAARWCDQALEPALSNFAGNYTTEIGRNWADRYTRQVRQHFHFRTTIDVAKAALC